MAVLIITTKGDSTATIIAASVRMNGGVCDIWYTSEFPHRNYHTTRISENQSPRFFVDPLFSSLTKYKTIWLRKIEGENLDSAVLHPDDVAFVRGCLRQYNIALWNCLERLLNDQSDVPIRWMNQPQKARDAESKILQLSLATKLGISIPDTIISNDPTQIRKFIRSAPNGAIRKSMIPFYWMESQTPYANLTSIITEADLPADPILSSYPEIYQHLIHKRSEVRVYIVEDHTFSYHFSPHIKDAPVDWRGFHGRGKGVKVRDQTNEIINTYCRSLMTELNLKTASIEFAYDNDGKIYFLELNQAGQFLWMEFIESGVLSATVSVLMEQEESSLLPSSVDYNSVLESEEHRFLKAADQSARSSLNHHVLNK